jgi:lysophospholipase L1-like esterase
MDSPHITIDGTDPDRLFLIGSGVMTGTGVSSHSVSIAGNLARDISAATGRGIEVDIVPISGLIARYAALRLKAIPLGTYDAVVVAVGINDAIIGTPRREWRNGIQAMLAVIESALPARGQIFLITIADPTSTPLFRTLPARLAARHALALNADSRAIAAAHPQLTLIDFEVGPIDDPSRLYTNVSYARWSHQLAPSIIAGLNRIHSSR